MPKKTPKRVQFAAFKQQRLAAAGVELEMDDGKVVTIPPADLWPDDLYKVKGDEEYVRAILGDDADAFLAGGGTARVINSLIVEKAHLDVPESSASSGS